jgi:antitoxin VapB
VPNVTLNIKNKEFADTARELAQVTGETIAAAGLVALKRELLRQKSIKSLLNRVPDGDALGAVRDIQKRYADRPNRSALTDDEVLGYDEFGAPIK